MKDLVPDDDDIELLQENRISGVCQFPNESKKFKWLKKAGKSPKVVEQPGVSEDEGLLFGDIFGEEEPAYDMEEYELANFIVDDRESCRERSLMSCFKIKQKKPAMGEINTSAVDDLFFNEFFVEVSDVERDNKVVRILSCFKLNPFEFMKFSFDSSSEDVKKQYRKLSLMVHLDKCKHTQAKEAFGESVNEKFSSLTHPYETKITTLIENPQLQFSKIAMVDFDLKVDMEIVILMFGLKPSRNRVNSLKY